MYWNSSYSTVGTVLRVRYRTTTTPSAMAPPRESGGGGQAWVSASTPFPSSLLPFFPSTHTPCPSACFRQIKVGGFHALPISLAEPCLRCFICSLAACFACFAGASLLQDRGRPHRDSNEPCPTTKRPERAIEAGTGTGSSPVPSPILLFSYSPSLTWTVPTPSPRVHATHSIHVHARRPCARRAVSTYLLAVPTTLYRCLT